jgi:hypothetical protein
MSLLATLKALKTEGEVTDADFAVEISKQYLEVSDFPAASAEFELLPTPQVCQEETKTASKALEDFIADLENNLTFRNWLWEQTQ